MNPKAVGEASEARVLAHLVSRGVAVAIPFGNNQPYDFILDEGGALVRAQVKTGTLLDGVIVFKTSSVNGFTGLRTTYAGRADVFLVYCAATGSVYRVLVDSCGGSTCSLRVAPTRGGPISTIRWAKDHLVA